MTDDMTYLKAEAAAVRNEIDASVSYVFQKLIDNKGRTAKAVSNKDSLTVYMTGATQETSLLGRVLRLGFPKKAPYLTEAMVRENAIFKEYSDILSQQGYEVNLDCVLHNDGRTMFGNWTLGIGLSTLFAGFASGHHGGMALGGMTTLFGLMDCGDAYSRVEMSFSPKASPA